MTFQEAAIASLALSFLPRPWMQDLRSYLAHTDTPQNYITPKCKVDFYHGVTHCLFRQKEKTRCPTIWPSSFKLHLNVGPPSPRSLACLKQRGRRRRSADYRRRRWRALGATWAHPSASSSSSRFRHQFQSSRGNNFKPNATYGQDVWLL